MIADIIIIKQKNKSTGKGKYEEYVKMNIDYVKQQQLPYT